VGDIFSIGGYSCKGPDDADTLPLLLDHLLSKKDWESVSGQFTAVLVHSAGIEAYRSPFSPYLLFYQDDSISDSLLDFMGTGHTFSQDYFHFFVLDRPGLQFTSPLTPLVGVFRLPPHSSVCLKPNSKHKLVQYPFKQYEWVEEQPQVEGFAQGLKEVIGESLKWHLKKSEWVAAELSGGLDSSFIASYLADLKPNSVHAHMYSYRKHPSHSFSEKCAQIVAQQKQIQLKVIDSAQVEATDLSQPLPFQNEPIDFYWQGALFGPLCHQLLPAGASLFTGFGCDQILMRNQEIVGQLFQHKGFFKTLPLVRDIAHSLDRPVFNFYYQFLISTLPKPILSRLLDGTRSLRLNPFKIDELAPHLTRHDRITWISTGQRFSSPKNLIALHQEGREEARRFFSDTIPQPNLNYLVAPHYVLGPYLEPLNVKYTHPFCDSRVIEYVMRQIPTLKIHDFSTPYKNLLREAQKGITPEEVRLRKRDEFSFDGYYYSLLKKNSEILRNILEEGINESSNWIEPSTLRRSFESMCFGSFTNSEVTLSRFLSYFIWKKNFLRHFSKAQTCS
jgi:hypothetical protein